MFAYTEELFIDPHENIHLERLVSGAEGDSVCKHTHDFIELVFVEKGNMVHIVDNRPLKLLQGSLLLLFPGQTHSYIALNDFGVSLINFCIRRSFGEAVLRRCLPSEVSGEGSAYQAVRLLPGFCPVIHLNETAQKQKGIYMEDILFAYYYKPEGYKETMEGGVAKLLTAFFDAPVLSADGSEKLPERILSLLESDFMAHDMSLHKIAVKLNYDSGYLNKSFKNYCGITITDYIQKKRMNMAKHLLWETDMSVDDIARFVGYDNKYFFYKLFKQLYQLTPSELRRRYLKYHAERFTKE